MTLPRTLVAVLTLGSGFGLSCYSERLPPPTFRYACDSNADCGADEICRRGLCERPCSQLTAAEDCPLADGFATCFNGVCASACEVGAGYCPSGQECLTFDVGDDGNGDQDTPTVGICGLSCDAGDNADLCPEGEICIAQFGTCAVDCRQGQACPDGYSCFFGVCAPEGTELPSGSTSDGSTSDGSTSDGSTSDGSSGAAQSPDDEER